MKNFISLLLIACLSYGSVYAQESTSSALLEHYYGIKNALVEGNSAEAAKHASEFEKSVADKSVPAALQAKLGKDAKSIAASTDIAKQRIVFAGFSNNMINLVKAAKPAAPVYVEYCPMKKASWLSAEQEIKNPYYGDAMLSCGSVKETIKP